MQILILSSLLAVTLAGSARAELANRIDGNKSADVNGKNAVLPTLTQPTLNEPTVTKPNSSQPNAHLPHGTKRFDNYATPTHNLNSLAQPTVSYNTIPQTNFSAKRDAHRQDIVAEPTMGNTTAPISDHVIRPYTAGGEDELVQQLSKPR